MGSRPKLVKLNFYALNDFSDIAQTTIPLRVANLTSALTCQNTGGDAGNYCT
jgi:hypothetical protein